MSKKTTQNTVLPHTEAKLKFYIHYLERYLPILVKTPHVNKINIYDMFCGQAIYDDGKESGAVRAFNKIKEVQQNNPDNNTEITLLLNDLDTKRIEDIKSWLNKQTSDFITVVHNEDATDLIPKLIKGINEKQTQQTRNLVFIDPYGYKEIDKSLIENLMTNGRTEIILFLPINQINRFKGKTVGDNIETDFLPLKRFIEQFDINIGNVGEDMDLINAIEAALSFDDSHFSTSYHIKNQQGKYYALFFMTSHILGLQKIIEVKWQLDKQKGKGFDNTNQTDMFLEVEQISQLEIKLKDYLQETKDNNKLYEWTLKQGFLPSHTSKILKEYQKNNQLKVMPENARKGSFYMNHANHKNNEIKVSIQLL